MENCNKKYFETIKCDDYEVFNLSYHTKRIADTIAININLQDYIYPPTNKLIKCKINIMTFNINFFKINSRKQRPANLWLVMFFTDKNLIILNN